MIAAIVILSLALLIAIVVAIAQYNKALEWELRYLRLGNEIKDHYLTSRSWSASPSMSPSPSMSRSPSMSPSPSASPSWDGIEEVEDKPSSAWIEFRNWLSSLFRRM